MKIGTTFQDHEGMIKRRNEGTTERGNNGTIDTTSDLFKNLVLCLDDLLVTYLHVMQTCVCMADIKNRGLSQREGQVTKEG